MLHLALGLHRELCVVAISAFDDAHPFDLLERKSSDLLFFVAHQTQSTNAAAIGKGDMFAVTVQLPTRLFVLNTAIVVLKLRIALLAGLLLATIIIEALDRRPRPISRHLAGLGIEKRGKRVFTG